jgi:tetratricopeptide (TPR) repeat protein
MKNTTQTKLLLLLLLISCSFLFAQNKEAKNIYKKAMSEVDAAVAKTSLERLAKEYTDDYYGQSALLELAKINILQREYKLAISSLKNISNSKISEKEYWLANAYLKTGKNDKAIISAQNFIFITKDTAKAENAYLLIAEAYINQKIYKRALSTLETLRTSQYIANQIALVHFKIGFCNEMLGDFEQALRSYKKLKIDFPYHQYTYEAEDRMKNITGNTEVTENETIAGITPTKTDSKSAKGEYEVFLQVGAFSATANAENLGKKVMSLGFNFSIFPKTKNGKKLYVVAVGPFESDALKPAISKLKDNGLDSFVLKRVM